MRVKEPRTGSRREVVGVIAGKGRTGNIRREGGHRDDEQKGGMRVKRREGGRRRSKDTHFTSIE